MRFCCADIRWLLFLWQVYCESILYEVSVIIVAVFAAAANDGDDDADVWP